MGLKISRSFQLFDVPEITTIDQFKALEDRRKADQIAPMQSDQLHLVSVKHAARRV